MKNYLSIKFKAFLLRFFTKKRTPNFNILKTKKILFLRYDRIGDMIITTPVFRELKLNRPKIQLDVLASKENIDVIKYNPYISKIYTNNKHNFFKDLITLFLLRKENYDLCIEFDHSVIPHIILRLLIIRPKKIISVKKDGRYSVPGRELKIYDYYTDRENNQHFKDIWLKTLKPIGVESKNSKYDIFLSDYSKNLAKKFLKDSLPYFKIFFNLEGAVKGKKIPFDDFVDISKKIITNFSNVKIFVISSPKNYYSTKLNVDNISNKNIIMSFKTESILEASALLSHADIIVSPDTSIVHIASAYNIPVVSIHEDNEDSFRLFSPTSDIRHTLFSKYSNSLLGYDKSKLIEFLIELIKTLKK